MLLFRVASELKIGTVAELEQRLLAVELEEWAAYFELKAKAEKDAIDKAKSESATTRGRPSGRMR